MNRYPLRLTMLRCRRDTHQIYRQSADGAPQFRPAADSKAAKHLRRGGFGGNTMLRHVMQAIALAFALAPAILAAPPLAATPAAARPIVEIAFVLDTTGSMGPLIEGAKRKIWSIALAIMDASPDGEIRMGLVAYRDIGDVYVTKRFNLTTDIQDLYGEL